MESSSSGGDLQRLLEAIKSSEVVEDRVRLLQELDGIDSLEKSDLNSLIESLIIFWEDFTCLDISQCSLNKSILHLAARYLESDISECLVQFLDLGTKGNIWCKKHLQMTLMSTDDSPEEEHSSFFYLLVLDLLNYSASSYSAVARYFGNYNKGLVVSLENFISQQLTLIKDLVSEIKKIHTLNSELLKGVQLALDALIRLCRVYCNGVDWDVYHAKTDDERRECNEAARGDHAMVVTKCTVEKLCELGVAAANGGGNLVSLLNMSWKGVVSLLQLGKGALALKVNITGVIMTLISLATEVLRCASDTWSNSMEEKVSAVDAKRIFLPTKFYLIHAVRIISQYQTHALSVYKEIALCVIVILTFRITLSKLEHLRSASEVLAEILEPTSLHLLNSLLSSAQVEKESKLQILDWLFTNENYVGSAAEVTSSDDGHGSLNAIFSSSPSALNKEKKFFLGRVSLFLNLLKGAADLEDDVRLDIAKRLGWFLDILVEEDVYSAILVLKTPSAYNSNQSHELTYQPMFSAVLHALKTFTITVSSSPAWDEVESFLIENLYHPHILCWEIVTELWCFILRHADTDLVNDVIDKLCVLLGLSSSESIVSPDSALRRTARLICILVTYGPDFMVDKVHNSINDYKSECQSNMHTALLMEGFPLNFLSEKNRSIAKQRIVTQYFEFLESFEDKSQGQSYAGIYGAPVIALCAAVQSLQVSLSDTEMKTLRFLIAIIHKYKTSTDITTKDNYCRLIGELLGIISNMKHLYSFDEMEGVILELQKLLISKRAISDEQLFLCKPNLASFMGGLGHVELTDSDDSPRSLAALELYHMLLRERHWAFVHLSITAFGDFAAHTSCNQLRSFIPEDAALSFDLDSGNEVDEERFISELKIFLEKERTCPVMQASLDQLTVLVKEGQMLKEKVRNSVNITLEDTPCDAMEIDEEKLPNKKRKFPDGICRGVELLQSGLEVMVDGLSQWQQNQFESKEFRDMFLTHFTRLEDVIAHLVSLADSG